jgi:aryl-alcohol dehydrogenase-like predicted oxidoreductase
VRETEPFPGWEKGFGVRYREFGAGSGLRVSEIALGTALFGTAWGYGSDPQQAREIFETYAAAGGNFIDTADFYQAGQAEETLGGLLEGRRDAFVVGTKYSLGADAVPDVLTTGNSRKTMVRSVEASLKRLRTDRLDLFWAHMPDGLTAIDEVARGLEDLRRDGKILYAGLSDFAAWQVSRAATIAELRGWGAIVGLQTQYSLVERTSDRELLPMAGALGLGVTAWSPLGGGLLTGKYRRAEPGRATTFGAVIHREDTPAKIRILDRLEAVAREVGAPSSQVALAWMMARGIIPVIGPRTVDQLADNIAAARLVLPSPVLDALDQASAVDLGFPHAFLAEAAQRERLAGGAAGVLAPPPTVSQAGGGG